MAKNDPKRPERIYEKPRKEGDTVPEIRDTARNTVSGAGGTNKK